MTGFHGLINPAPNRKEIPQPLRFIVDILFGTGLLCYAILAIAFFALIFAIIVALIQEII